MSNRKSLWIPLAGSILLLLLVVLVILSASSTLSFAATSPPAPADVEGSDSWTWRGPSHNTAVGMAPHGAKIVMDPNNPSVVYVGTNQGVYRSANTGDTWEARNEGLGGYGDLVVSDLEIDPANSQRLIIGTWGYGLLQSTDAGLHWARLADPLASPDLQPSAALDPEPPPVRVGGESISKPIEASDPLKKSLSSDMRLPQRQPVAGEQVESPRALPNPMPWTPVRDVAIHPSNPNKLFACIDNGYGLYVSNDGGGFWVQVSGLPVDSCRTITFAPSNTSIRYASFGSWDTTGGFYRTTTGGASWTEVGSGYIAGTVTAVAIHPTNPDFVLAGTFDDGLYRSTNGGDSWTNVSTPSSLPDLDFYSVAFAPGNPNVAYAGGRYWVYRSGDGGATWVNADTGFPTEYVWGLAIHPSSSSTVLVGAADRIWGGVYKRISDESSFALTASGMTDTFVLDIEQDPNDANVLYAATWGGGAFRSDDGGLTWNARLAYPYVYSLEATQGPTGTILYAGTFYNTYGVLKSWDRGLTWKEVSKDYSSDISFDIKSLDGGPNNLVAATAYGVEYSTDGGTTWENATGLDEGVVLKIAQSPFYANRLLAATYGGGVWSSTDTGASWSETSTGLGSQYVYDVAFSPNYNTAYAATLGVYRSENGGGSWYSSGVSGTYVRALDTLGAPGFDVFAGTHNRGVFMAPQQTNWWFDLNDGLGEHRIRSLFALDYDTLFAGTNGRGAWEYTIVNRPRPRIHLPLVLKNYRTGPSPESLYGRVTYNGSPETGTQLQLRLSVGSIWSTYATTYTDSNGDYEFSDPPVLGTEQYMYVRWINDAEDPTRLSSWSCNLLLSTSGPEAHECNFDVDNIDLVSPSPDASESMPVTFSWNMRAITTDSYEVNLADIGDLDPWWWQEVGYADSYTLTSLPSGFSPGVLYGWLMWVYGPDGYGVSYYYNPITFLNSGRSAEIQAIPAPRHLLEDSMERMMPRGSP